MTEKMLSEYIKSIDERLGRLEVLIMNHLAHKAEAWQSYIGIGISAFTLILLLLSLLFNIHMGR